MERQNVKTDYLPKFESAAAERQHRKRRLAVACRVFAELGFDEGIAGHITARDPERADHFWVNPFAMNFRQIRVSDLLLVNDQGEIVEGEGELNRAAFFIHGNVHAARPEVVAAAHAHPVHGVAWSTLGRELLPLTQDACSFYEDHAVHNSFNGVVLNDDDGKEIAVTLGDRKALILQNHGLLTVGKSVDEAVRWFIMMDRACQVQLLACAAGDPIPLSPEIARTTAEVMGSDWAGWIGFQSYYDWIVRAQPDVLD